MSVTGEDFDAPRNIQNISELTLAQRHGKTGNPLAEGEHKARLGVNQYGRSRRKKYLIWGAGILVLCWIAWAGYNAFTAEPSDPAPVGDTIGGS